MKKLIIILIPAIVPMLVFSQSNWEKADAAVFMNAIREYEQTISENESYSLETNYSIYNDFTDELPVQTFRGTLICRSGKELNVSQMGHLMVQNTEMNLTIDTLNKQILLQNPDHSFYYRKTVQDYSVFSEMAETVYQKQVNGKTSYMLELKKGYPYRAMEFVFLEKSFISQIIIYSNRPYYEEGDGYSGDQAKIVLDFKNFRKGKTVDFSSFTTIKDCIAIHNNEISPVGRFKHFEVIDLRN